MGLYSINEGNARRDVGIIGESADTDTSFLTYGQDEVLEFGFLDTEELSEFLNLNDAPEWAESDDIDTYSRSRVLLDEDVDVDLLNFDTRAGSIGGRPRRLQTNSRRR